MRAAIHTRYGPPDVLQIRDVAKPSPGDGEVLVAVRAAAINPLDSYFISGWPYLFRLMSGLPGPKRTCPGVDLAGRVEAVGGSVTRFKPGDDVFGVAFGSFAEYVCAREDKLALKPRNVTFEQAAAVPIAGATALLGLRDHGHIRAGHRVLVNGAAGGVGSFAVQIARAFGADVTGVCSTKSVDLVRSIGASRVIDYTREDFTTSAERYDIVLDCVAKDRLAARMRLLAPSGTYVVAGVGGAGGRWIGPLPRVLRVGTLSRARKDVIMYLARVNQAGLEDLKELMEAGKVTPVIDRSYPLSEAAEAVRYFQQGHARGKTVVTMGGSRP